MDLAALLLRFRQRADDLADPPLWSDDELIAYANEAEAEAVERAYLIYDQVHPHACMIVGAPDRADYPLHPSILEVDRVTRPGTDGVLDREGLDFLDRIGEHWPQHQGTPLFYVVQGRKLILYPRPSERMTFRLGVYRLPTRPMAHGQDRPEIDERYHERLVDWMLYRGYQKRDSDANATALADRHLAEFARNFGTRESADTLRKQAERRRPVAAINSLWSGGGVRGRRRRLG